ncbi:MAG: class IV adenylate cyclase [Acidobacteria bacterium]|nr:class IV adenylate cyclase [Acidobacteriota bacterium]
MSSSPEIEIKFRVADIQLLVQRLRELGLEEITPRTHEMNLLFDLPGNPLRNRGDLLRLRHYGSDWILTHKSKLKNDSGRYKARTEIETRVEDGEKMATILQALRFEPRFRYEKYRAEWRGERGHVVIDETPIGDFAEIEGPGEWIDELARSLGVASEQFVRDTYAGLFFAWKRATHSSATEMTFAAVHTRQQRSDGHSTLQ